MIHDRRMEAEKAIADYCRIWPTPYALSPNLGLISELLAEVARLGKALHEVQSDAWLGRMH